MRTYNYVIGIIRNNEVSLKGQQITVCPVCVPLSIKCCQTGSLSLCYVFISISTLYNTLVAQAVEYAYKLKASLTKQYSLQAKNYNRPTQSERLNRTPQKPIEINWKSGCVGVMSCLLFETYTFFTHTHICRLFKFYAIRQISRLRI